MLKMKMKFNISLALLLALSVSLTSCFKNDEDDIFDKSASERLEQAKKDYTDILTDKGGKWELQYFANESEEGYDYIVTFSKNGTVQISGYNKWIGESKTGIESNTYGTDNSLWEVITDDGPVLSFNTYNKVFHIFADPADIGSTEINEGGRGHEGDYEFDLMKYSGDTLYLEGKKHGLKMIMTRVASDVNDEAYLNDVQMLKDSLFSAKIPRFYLKLNDGKRYVITGGSNGFISYFEEGSDSVATTNQANFVVSHEGVAFLSALKVDGHNIQHFATQPDGSLICTDDGKSVISAGPLAGVVLHKSLIWSLDTKTMNGRYQQLFEKVKLQIAQKKAYSLSGINIYYCNEDTRKGVKDVNAYVIEVSLKVKAGSTTGYPRPLFKVTPVIGADGSLQFTDLTLTNIDRPATYIETFPAIKELLDALVSDTFTLSASSALSPTAIKATSKSGETDNFMLKL